MRYTVYSQETKDTLDVYEYQLSCLKHSYHKLSSAMNNAALVRQATDTVNRRLEDTLNSVLGQSSNDGLVNSHGGVSRRRHYQTSSPDVSQQSSATILNGDGSQNHY